MFLVRDAPRFKAVVYGTGGARLQTREEAQICLLRVSFGMVSFLVRTASLLELSVVQEGQPAVFSCASMSLDAMKVTWHHEGRLLREVPSSAPSGEDASPIITIEHKALRTASGKPSGTLTTSVLHLKNVSSGDTGVYSCTFEDHLGTFSKSSRLVVEGKILVVYYCTNMKDVSQNSSVSKWGGSRRT